MIIEGEEQTGQTGVGAKADNETVLDPNFVQNVKVVNQAVKAEVTQAAPDAAATAKAAKIAGLRNLIQGLGGTLPPTPAKPTTPTGK